MNLWKWLSVAAVTLLIGFTAWGLQGKGIEVETAEVVQADIAASIDEEGKTRLPRRYQVTMPFSGYLQSLTAIEGNNVDAQELLAEINPKELLENVNEAQAAVDRLEASLAENADTGLETTTRQQAQKFVESMGATVLAAEEQLTSGREKIDYAENVLGRVSRLLQSQSVSQDEYDRAKLAHVESQVTYRQDNLVLKAVTALQAATNLLPGLVDDYLTKKSLQRNVLAAQRREAEARLAQAIIHQQQGNVVSPIDGTILEKHATGNEYLNQGALLVVIGNLQELEVEADVLTEDAMQVQKGDSVELTWLGSQSNSTTWPATVAQILPAGFTKTSSLGVEQQRVTIRIALDPQTRDLMLAAGVQVGYRLQVKIVTDQAQQANVVPRTALFRDSTGAWAVFAVEHGRAVHTVVEVGVMNDRQAQITSGLSLGDPVIVAPDTRLNDGDRVTVAQP